ncbi:hypothetical protein RhiJN_15250 [Ceratobasidium sp. AG-Ba]|nr:hypothetical protein RhiJN_15250 [Ceratobasidium sp. AG-Ba]
MAHESIFSYLLPGRVSVWFDAANIKGEIVTGVTFKIGSPGCKLEQIPGDLLERCRDIFLDDPDEFILKEDREWKEARVYEWKQKEVVIGIVENLDFIESDIVSPDLY